MKVFDLRCASHHVFEGWFASEAEFLRQKDGGWLSCPVCGSIDVAKALSAPRLARKSNSAKNAPPVSAGKMDGVLSAETVDLQRMQRAWLEFSRHVVAHSEDVGSTFAQVARQMHEGEVPERAIRGTATDAERKDLAEDGIEVVPLLLPESAKHRLQ